LSAIILHADLILLALLLSWRVPAGPEPLILTGIREDGMWSDGRMECGMWSDAVQVTDILLRSRCLLLSLPFPSSRNNLFPCFPTRRILVLPHNPLSCGTWPAHCMSSLSCPWPACCVLSFSCPLPARCSPTAHRRPCPVLATRGPLDTLLPSPVLATRRPLAAALVLSATGSPPDPVPLQFVA